MVATDTEALAPPAAFSLHPVLWVAKMIAFYYHHEDVFRALGKGLIAALIYVIVMAVFMFVLHKFKHPDPPEDEDDD